MNKDEIICSHMAFRGEDEYLPEHNALLEVTDVKADGTIEIAFTEHERKQIAYFAMKRKIQEELRLLKQGKVITEQQRSQRVIAAFTKMHTQADAGRNKV